MHYAYILIYEDRTLAINEAYPNHIVAMDKMYALIKEKQVPIKLEQLPIIAY